MRIATPATSVAFLALAMACFACNQAAPAPAPAPAAVRAAIALPVGAPALAPDPGAAPTVPIQEAKADAPPVAPASASAPTAAPKTKAAKPSMVRRGVAFRASKRTAKGAPVPTAPPAAEDHPRGAPEDVDLHPFDARSPAGRDLRADFNQDPYGR
jgi:hypothetical protein